MSAKDTYSKFDSWLSKVIKDEKPKDDIIAYNIGIFKTPVSYTLYLMGSKKYDPEDSDWACKQDYNPDAMYFDFPKEYAKNKSPDDIEKEVVSYAEKFAKKDDYKKSFFAKALALTVGFDDGELFTIK